MDPRKMTGLLQQAYPDSEVEVTDLTGTSDHFEVRVSSARFRNLSRLEQHKSVMQVFDQELKSGEVHALSIKTTVK